MAGINEILKPSGNINALWSQNSHTLVDDQDFPSAPTDGGWATANSNDDFEQQQWLLDASPLNYVGGSVSGIALRVNAAVEEDEFNSSNPSTLGVQIRVGGVWQTQQSFTVDEDDTWYTTLFTGAWSNSDLTLVGVEIQPLDAMTDDDEFTVGAIQVDVAGTEQSVIVGSGSLHSSSQTAPTPSLIVRGMASLQSDTIAPSLLSTPQPTAAGLGQGSMLSANAAVNKLGFTSLNTDSSLSATVSIVKHGAASLQSNSELRFTNDSALIIPNLHDPCSTDVYAEAVFTNQLDISSSGNLSMASDSTIENIAEVSPFGNLDMNQPAIMSGVCNLIPLGSLDMHGSGNIICEGHMTPSGNLSMNGPITMSGVTEMVASGSRSHGPFDITCLQSLYPSGDVDNSGVYNELFSQTDTFKSVDEGTLLDGDGYSIADDHFTWISPSAVLPSSEYVYTSSMSQVYVKPESSLLRLRMKGERESNRDPIQYEFSDIHWTDASGNLIATYEDYDFIGDNDWVDVSLEPTTLNKHRTFDEPNWPESVDLNSQSTTLSFNLTHTVLGGSGGFTCGFANGYDNSYQESGAFCFNTWFPIWSGLVITAIDLCNSGANIDVFNHIGLYISAPATGIRRDTCIKPVEFFSYNEQLNFSRNSRTEWVNEDSVTNNVANNVDLQPMLESVLSSGGGYITQTSSEIADSGSLTLRFAHDVDHFFHADSGLLKLQIEVKAGDSEPTPEFNIEVDGFSQDGILADTQPYITGLSASISGTAFTIYEIPLTVPTGPAPSVVNGVGLATELYQSGIQLSSPFFESFFINMYGIPSGSQVGLAQFCMSESEGQEANTLYIAGKAEHTPACADQLLIPTGHESGNSIWDKGPSYQPMSTVLGVPQAHVNSDTIKTNYSRRWRGNVGSGDLMDYGHFKLQERAGTAVTSSNESGVHNTAIITTGGGDIWHSNIGWRLSNGSLFDETLPGWTSDHKTIDWTALSNGGSNFEDDPLYGQIGDAFDVALRVNNNTDYVTCDFADNPENDFSVFIRFSPDHPASGTFGTATSGTYLIGSFNGSPMEFAIGYDNQRLFLAAAEADGTLHVAMDTAEYHEYQYPLSVIGTYGSDNTLKLYTDNEISNVGEFNHLRAESDSFTRNVDGGVVTVGYAPGSGNGASAFIDEFGVASTAFTSGEAQGWFDRMRVKMWASGEAGTHDSNKLWSYVQDNSDEFGTDGSFDQCMYNADFDRPVVIDTNQNYLEFSLKHDGSGYQEVVTDTFPSGVPNELAYHTQIENDFVRFQLSDVSNDFYSIMPRITKATPSGYAFRDQSLVTEVWLDHVSTPILWNDGTIGPKLTASLYSDSGVGLVTRQTKSVESGCIRSLTFDFPFEEWVGREELWSVYPPENMYYETEPRILMPDINSMFLQLDLSYPSGQSFDSEMRLFSIGVNVNDAMCSEQAQSGDFSLFVSGVIPSGFNNEINLYINSPVNSSTPLFTHGRDSGNWDMTLAISGDTKSLINNLGSGQGMTLYMPPIASSVLTMPLVCNNVPESSSLPLTMYLLDTYSEADMNLFVQSVPSGEPIAASAPLFLYPSTSGTSGIFDKMPIYVQSPDIDTLRTLTDNTTLYIRPTTPQDLSPFAIASGMNLTVFNTKPASLEDPDDTAMNLFLKQHQFPPSGVLNMYARSEAEECFISMSKDAPGEFVYNNDMCFGDAGSTTPSGMSHCISIRPESSLDCELLRLDNVIPEGSGSAKKKITGLSPGVTFDIEIEAISDDEARIDRTDRWMGWESGVKIVASGRATHDLYGWAVDIDNKTMVVGAPKNDLDPSGNNFVLDAGAVYTYTRGVPNFPSGGVWNLEQKIVPPENSRHPGIQFGHSVAVQGDTMIVGAPYGMSGCSVDFMPSGASPSPADMLSMVFVDESMGVYVNQLGFDPVESRLTDYLTDITDWHDYTTSGNYDVALALYQVIPSVVDDLHTGPIPLIPEGQDFPDFVRHATIGRNDAFGTFEGNSKPWYVSSGVNSGDIIDLFLDVAGETVPTILGLYIDTSASLGRDALEPAIDEFRVWYTQWSYENSTPPTSGFVFEHPISTERWVDEAKNVIDVAINTPSGSALLYGSGTLDQKADPLACQGRAFVYKRNQPDENGDENSLWEFHQELFASSGVGSAKHAIAPNAFGWDVAINDDERTVAIGAPDAIGQFGAVYTYRHLLEEPSGSPENNTWGDRQLLQYGRNKYQDEFGISVDLDKDVMLVGAPMHSFGVFDTVNVAGSGKTEAGVAYVYRRENRTQFVPHSGVMEWTAPGNFDRAAFAGSMSGNYDDLENIHSGDYFYKRQHVIPNNVGLVYILTPEQIPDSGAMNNLKTWLRLGDRRLVIGGEYEGYIVGDTSKDAIHSMLEELGSPMTLGTSDINLGCNSVPGSVNARIDVVDHQIFTSPNTVLGVYANDTNVIDGGTVLGFTRGNSAQHIIAYSDFEDTTSEVILFADSNMFQGECPEYRSEAYGAPFIRNLYPAVGRTNLWSNTTKLFPSGTNARQGAEDYFSASGFTPPGDRFGYSVAVSEDKLLVGAPYHGWNASGDVLTLGTTGGAGAAFLFDVLPHSGILQSDKFRPSGLDVGYIVNSEAQGDALIGSNNYTLQEFAELQTPDKFGWSVDLECDMAVVGAPGNDFGVTETIIGGQYNRRMFSFGFDRPERVYGDDSLAVLSAGGMYSFVRESGLWREDRKIVAQGHGAFDQRFQSSSISGSEEDLLGWSVALDNKERSDSDYVLVGGAYGHMMDVSGESPVDSGGAVYFYDGTIQPQLPLQSPYNSMHVAVFGHSGEVVDLQIFQSGGPGLTVTSSGSVTTTTAGELFVEAFAYDGPSGDGMAASHVSLVSVTGDCRDSTSSTNSAVLFMQGPSSIYLPASGSGVGGGPPQLGMNLFINRYAEAIPAQMWMSVSGNATPISGEFTLMLEAKQEVTDSFNLFMPSGLASGELSFTNYIRGK